MSSPATGDPGAGVAAEDGGVGHRCVRVCQVGFEGAVDLAGDRAFETADDVLVVFAGFGAPGRVALGAGAASEPEDGDEVQRPVGLAVASGVEPVAVGLAGGCFDWAGAAERRERALAVAQPIDVLAGGDQELAGVTGRDPQQTRRSGCGGRDQRRELSV